MKRQTKTVKKSVGRFFLHFNGIFAFRSGVRGNMALRAYTTS
jgi:hypothetical protein